VLWTNIEPKGVDLMFPDALTLSKFDDDLLNTNDLNQASIRGISQDGQGNLWVGTSGEGIRRITPQGYMQRLGAESGFTEAVVRGITTDRGGTLWFSTATGLLKMPPGGKKAIPLRLEGIDPARTNYLKGVYEVQPHDYLFATMGGLFRQVQNTITRLTPSSEGYSGAMFYDAQSRQLWVGRSEKDLRCYAVRPDTLLPMYDRLVGHSILWIERDPAPGPALILWLGTDNGLVKFNASQKKIERIFTVKDGLPNAVVYSAIFDEAGGLWLTTNNGLAHLNRQGKVRRIRQSEGIEFNSFAAHKAKDGGLYLGSTQGLYFFYPASLARPSSRGLRILNLRVNDSIYHVMPTRPVGRSLEFRAHENDVTFEVASLDYLSETPPSYEYRMVGDGGSQQWVSNDIYPFVRFQNLPPGAYRVTFRALDANGIYTDEQTVGFSVLPPFWQRWWFVLAVLILGALLVYYLLKIYLRRQQLVHQKLMNRVIMAQESERLRIAMDIHDDVNNTLAAAKGYLHTREHEEPSVWVERMGYSRTLIQKATDDLRAITHDLMPIPFDQQPIVDVIKQKVDEWNAVEGPKFSFITAGEQIKLTAEAEQMIYRIISEMAQNIRKHSNAKTGIIQLIYQKTALVVSVEDDGVGFKSPLNLQAPSQGIGLKNIYSRAEYLQASVEVSSDSKGVLIQLIVPYDPNLPHSSTLNR
jgi:signal transduction histidine kinase